MVGAHDGRERTSVSLSDTTLENDKINDENERSGQT